MSKRIWAVLLAAGEAKRMGRQKLLLPMQGESMIRLVAKKALDSSADGIAVVYNPCEPIIQAELANLPVCLVQSPEAGQGMSASLRAGIQFVHRQGADAGLILLGDQPGIQTQVIDQLIREYRKASFRIGQAQYEDWAGHPVLFDRCLFHELMQVQGDIGARQVMRRYAGHICKVAVGGNQPPDIDTPEEYQAYIKNRP